MTFSQEMLFVSLNQSLIVGSFVLFFIDHAHTTHLSCIHAVVIHGVFKFCIPVFSYASPKEADDRNQSKEEKDR